MTSSANDEWNYNSLIRGSRVLALCASLEKYKSDYADIIHTLDFIEYNMNKLEIIGGNGDLI